MQKGALAELVERVGSGDRDAFARFYDVTLPSIRRLVVDRVAPGIAAAGVLQEIYFELWPTAGRFAAIDPDPARWILKVSYAYSLAAARQSDRQSGSGTT